MKTLNYSTLISSVIMGLSIVAASFILQGTESSKSISANTEEANMVQSERPLMTLEETAEFLNLTEYQVKSMISSENALREQYGSGAVHYFLISWCRMRSTLAEWGLCHGWKRPLGKEENINMAR